MHPLPKVVFGISLFAASTAFVSICAGIYREPVLGQSSHGAATGHEPQARTKAQALPAVKLDQTNVREKLIAAHNQIRAEAKLAALAVSNKLQTAAEQHARDMAERRKMTHEGSDGSSPLDRIKAQGYNYRRAAENIAAGRYTLDRLMNGWMESPPHKKNILGSFSQIGAACAIAEDGKRYWCVTFGLPARR
jgi:uncharacterized protein YkwD